MKTVLLNVLTAVFLISLGGCSTFFPKVELPENTKNFQQEQRDSDPVLTTINQNTTGSLYNNQTFRPLFEDARARFKGDILTIQISESMDASQSNSSSISKSDSASIDVPLIQGFFGSNDLRAINAEASSDRSFSGEGESEATNSVVGTLTVSVTDVLPNGYLRVAGEKQIGTNRELQTLKFAGIVNPADIQPGNTVASSRVADARLEYRGKGAVDSATAMGWLSRFFLTVLPF